MKVRMRHPLQAALAGLVLILAPLQCARADALPPTPAQMLGPYYPLQPDPQAGSDLTRAGTALGRPLAIVGRVRDTQGRGLPGILVEIWQTNAHGRYHHPHDQSPLPLDPAFAGYGRGATDGDGGYRFRTIWPAAYPGRTPHVHFRLSRGKQELLVTQMYLPGEAGRANARDGVFMGVRDSGARQRLLGVPLGNDPNSLRFDIVIEAARGE